jgi:hypothetical protein
MTKSYRPMCINHGCNSYAVPIKGRVGEPGVRYRVFCGTCHKHNYSGYPLPNGVRPYRTGQCSNRDGRLGFPCLINWDLITEDYCVRTEVDHINGDHTDNRSVNLQELCPICHMEKGRRSGDFNGWR